MEKRYAFFAAVLLFPAFVHAQADTAKRRGSDHQVAVSVEVPVGVFGRSHLVGAGLAYSWSHHRFGSEISTSKLIGLLLTGGGGYYLGKRITVGGYPFQYGGYTNLYVMGGFLCNTGMYGNITLTAGPVMDIYKSSSEFGWGARLAGSYYFWKKIATGPVITYQKHSQADALWTAGVSFSYLF